MGFHPLTWYCRPDANGVWATITDSTFGAYTPCGIDSLVVGTSHLVLLCLCFYRIWLIKKGRKVQRYSLRSNNYNHLLGLLAGYCTAEPLFRLVMGISIFDLDGQTGLLPFEIFSLIIEALAWCSMLVMIGVETRIYIREFRWYIRFGVAYVLVGDAVMLNLILPITYFYTRSVLHLYLSTLAIQLLFGVSLLVYIPHLNPYPGYIPVWNESLDDTEYEAPPGGEHICPERHASLFSRICFGWMTPLMQQGYKRPIIEEDVWKLDTWDQTETLIKNFQICWAEESKRSKPQILRALNGSLGRRFWFGGIFKIGNDLSQFAGPILLNYLLKHFKGNHRWISSPSNGLEKRKEKE